MNIFINDLLFETLLLRNKFFINAVLFFLYRTQITVMIYKKNTPEAIQFASLEDCYFQRMNMVYSNSHNKQCQYHEIMPYSIPDTIAIDKDSNIKNNRNHGLPTFFGSSLLNVNIL